MACRGARAHRKHCGSGPCGQTDHRHHGSGAVPGGRPSRRGCGGGRRLRPLPVPGRCDALVLQAVALDADASPSSGPHGKPPLEREVGFPRRSPRRWNAPGGISRSQARPGGEVSPRSRGLHGCQDAFHRSGSRALGNRRCACVPDGASDDPTMTKYLISFPAPAMNIREEDRVAVDEAAHAVIREAKHAEVYVFGGGIDESVAPTPRPRRSTAVRQRPAHPSWLGRCVCLAGPRAPCGIHRAGLPPARRLRGEPYTHGSTVPPGRRMRIESRAGSALPPDEAVRPASSGGCGVGYRCRPHNTGRAGIPVRPAG